MKLIGINGGVCCGGSYDKFWKLLMKLIVTKAGQRCGGRYDEFWIKV